MRVNCHFRPGSRRSEVIAEAMVAGARAVGLEAEAVQGFHLQDVRAGAVGVAYGWAHPEIFEAYRALGGHFVYVDLGWWNRKPAGDQLGGHHKVIVDGREPGPYALAAELPGDRFNALGLSISPWRTDGAHIVLAGMSAKSAETRGYAPQAWEKGMVGQLRALTARPIIYRPKPSWTDAKPIPGTIFSPGAQPLDAMLRDCHMLVTLHSNTAVDALMFGVPVNVQEGIAVDFSTPLVQIETPNRPEGRKQLMAKIAYQQWNVAEMKNGACWRHLLERTPLCA